MNIETSIASSALMSIGTKLGRLKETNTEAKIETTHAETQIDIVMTTRTRPLAAMTDFLRQPETAIARVAGMAESTSGWCSNRAVT